ncbi:hypothetical protein C8F01DRAFT_1361480 [Mycena amicta]|nr:hypothetical protein C8F01DRAFT_1361480 [Mycena amicta]
MLLPSIPKVLREFAACTSLSFLFILGMIHTLFWALSLYLASGRTLDTPLLRFIAAPAVQMAEITQLDAYLLVVFKKTLACTVVVFAAREVMSKIGCWMGWWDSEDEDDEVVQLESGKRRVGEKST